MTELVFRSMQFFEDDDTQIRMLAARIGVSKSVLIRGLVHLQLEKWNKLTENVSVPPKEFLDEIQTVINAGMIREAE